MTLREALEHVSMKTAIDVIAAENEAAAVERAQVRSYGIDDDRPNAVRTRTGAEAAAIADKPHLTGDPEWDAIEIAETDPTAEPVKIVGAPRA